MNSILLGKSLTDSLNLAKSYSGLEFCHHRNQLKEKDWSWLNLLFKHFAFLPQLKCLKVC